jgi:Asp-tRNA(Asn)/Glu-tRNA(Gln) amidotransferase A subunit family amidase
MHPLTRADNLDLCGTLTCGGSAAFGEWGGIKTESAVVVARALEKGASVVGKTTMGV